MCLPFGVSPSLRPQLLCCCLNVACTGLLEARLPLSSLFCHVTPTEGLSHPPRHKRCQWSVAGLPCFQPCRVPAPKSLLWVPRHSKSATTLTHLWSWKLCLTHHGWNDPSLVLVELHIKCHPLQGHTSPWIPLPKGPSPPHCVWYLRNRIVAG